MNKLRWVVWSVMMASASLCGWHAAGLSWWAVYFAAVWALCFWLHDQYTKQMQYMKCDMCTGNFTPLELMACSGDIWLCNNCMDKYLGSMGR